MDPQRYKKIKNIIMLVLESEASSMKKLIEDHCGDDTELKNEVLELLNSNMSETFLATTPLTLAAGTEEQEVLSGDIGRIKIKKLLAHGGMGDVYEAYDTLLERPVAIKIINQEFRMSAARRSGFLNEAKVISGLQHPNICQVYDFLEDEDKDVLVMELIEGQTLREAIPKQGTDVMSLLLQITRALVAAHERGIAHQDLKPENIMLTPTGQIKILDFGISSSETKNIKSENGISGTPGYMSPEQARGDIADTSSDIYSLALIMHELICGTKHFSSDETPLELIEMARNSTLKLDPKLSGAKLKLIQSMLSVKPFDRPSARDVLSQLLKIKESPQKRLRWTALVLILLGSGFLAWKYTTDLKHERQLAIDAKDQAITARQDAEELISFMLDDLNSGLQSVGRLDLMESVAEKAQEYYQHEGADKLSGQSAMALIRIAEVFDSQGKKQLAIEALERSIMILNQISKESPHSSLTDYRIATANNSLAEIYKLTGDFKLSKTHSKTAWKIGLELTEGSLPGLGGDKNLSALKRWYVLLKAIYLNSDAHMRQGQSDIAIKTLQDIRPVAIEAAKTEPLLKDRLADIEFKLCDSMYDAGFDDLAVQPCLGILELDKELYDANPENYRLYSNYAVDHMVLGRLYYSLNNDEKVISTMNEGIHHAEKIVAHDPDNSSSVNDLALMNIIKGKALIRSGHREQGVQLILKAEELLKPLILDEEEITYLNNMFSIHLHLNRKNLAVPIAEKLVAKGFKRREFLDLCNEFEIQICTNNE